MRTRSLMIVCTLAGLLAPVSVALAGQTVPNLRPLLVEALRTGRSSGVLDSPNARAFSRQFGAYAPILVEVERVGSHAQAGCGRLQVTSSQAGVVERDADGTPRPAKDQRLVYQVNFCTNGRFPVGEDGL